ncbi:MAG TPA: hypothetical protein VGI81_14075 [Tepidisphaeraceae bacterium]|jgi:hypothetical protein
MSERPIELPAETDFLDPRSQDLDERHAMRMFLGKTPEQAEAMFQQNFLFYQEDLLYMRSAAFRFYVVPALRYLLTDAADGDADAGSTFCSVLEDRAAKEPDALRPLAPLLAEGIAQILARFDRFDCDPDIYGDVPARYRALSSAIEQRASSVDGHSPTEQK